MKTDSNPIQQLPSNPFDSELEKEPGNYQLILRSTESVVDAGEELKVEVYISGFGNMNFPKLVFYPSADILDPSSRVIFDMQVDKQEDKAYWGGQEAPLTPEGLAIELHVLTPEVLFSKPRLQVKTESNTRNRKRGQTFAPVQFNLKIKNNARPGKYYIHLVLTYFDGKRWNTSSTKFQFNVRNLLERYALFAWSLAIAASFSTVIVAISEIPRVWQLFNKLFLMKVWLFLSPIFYS